MEKRFLVRAIQVAAVVLATAAIVQELSKPREERQWHGKVCFVPYDFRKPTWERVKETYWNPYERHVLNPQVFGLGWTINFYSLLENLGLVHQPAMSEESFLLPNKRMKEILRPE